MIEAVALEFTITFSLTWHMLGIFPMKEKEKKERREQEKKGERKREFYFLPHP